jgi:hypothetical protein
MGFMDKAKKLAEQAQEKIDEVQTKFNESQQAKAGGDQTGEPDKHGHPTDASAPPPTAATAGTPEAPVTPPTAAPGAPVAPPAPPAPPVEEARPPTPPSAPVEDPAGPGGAQDDGPPKMSQGDPLAG